MAYGRKTGGRKKGVPNKSTQKLKDAILTAAELAGSDGQGTDGLIGYCKFLAIKEPKAFSSLLGRVLPQDVKHDGEIKITELVVDL